MEYYVNENLLLYFRSSILDIMLTLCDSHNIIIDKLVQQTKIIYFAKNINDSTSIPLGYSIPNLQQYTLVLEMEIPKYRIIYSSHPLIPTSQFWLNKKINGNVKSFEFHATPEPLLTTTIKHHNQKLNFNEYLESLTVRKDKVINNWYNHNKSTTSKKNVENLHDFLIFSNSN